MRLLRISSARDIRRQRYFHDSLVLLVTIPQPSLCLGRGVSRWWPLRARSRSLPPSLAPAPRARAPHRLTRRAMGASASTPEAKPKKICCACPITKSARDACLPEHDEEKCKYLIEAHLRCLRDEGFDV